MYSHLDERAEETTVDVVDVSEDGTLGHLFEVQTKTYKTEWKFTRQTVTADGGPGFMAMKIPARNAADAQARVAEVFDGGVRFVEKRPTYFAVVPNLEICS